jgi:UDP-glucose 4-epimerase
MRKAVIVLVASFERYMREKRVLITGGLGFVGSNLARCLVGLGARVTLVDSLIPEYGGNLFNVSGIEDMKYLVQGQDIVFNLAGQTSHMDSMQDPLTDLEINAKSQLYILEACRLHNPKAKVVFASTRQIYGKPQYLPVDETHPLRPVDINGVNKLAGEWYHLLYNDVHGLRTCVLRLTNTVGPRMRVKDARQTFLGIWIRLLVEGKPFEVWGGKQLRDFTYVDDAVDALLMVAASSDANGQVYNLGGDGAISLRDLAGLLLEVNGGGEYVVREFPSDRKRIDIGDYYADYRLLQSTLGWKPRVPLREGLDRTLSFYRQYLEYYI